jgi:hypothetical protein
METHSCHEPEETSPIPGVSWIVDNPGVPDPSLATDISVHVESRSLVSYKLWIRPAGKKWFTIGPEDTDASRVDHWMFVAPFPHGSELGCTVGAWGYAGDAWQVRISLRQRALDNPLDEWDECGRWTLTGAVGADGYGGDLDVLAESPRVKLLQQSATVDVGVPGD